MRKEIRKGMRKEMCKKVAASAMTAIMAAVVTAGLITGCGGSGAKSSAAGAENKSGTSGGTVGEAGTHKGDVGKGEAGKGKAGKGEAGKGTVGKGKDVVTALLPPVSATYQNRLAGYAKAFEEANPGVELKITTASWEDMKDKLDVQVNAGSPPDIAFIGYDDVAKYLDTGMMLDIGKYASQPMISDYNEKIINYFRSGDGLYGFPAYASIQAIGGNRAMLEQAGIDWKKVQKEGWTYDEFRQDIKKGVVKDGNKYSRYGFVFACSGVAAKDYFTIMVKNAGMPAPFDKNLKYAYTSSKMVPFLEDLRALIDDGSMPRELSSVDAGKRWNMFLTGQTMITGKGLASFEKSAAANNKKLALKDEGAVEGSVEADYIVLPVPEFNGNPQQASCAVDGYVCFRGKDEPTKEHVKNVVDAAYFLASGDRAAETCQEGYLTPVCKTGEEAYEKLPPIEGKNEANTETVKMLSNQVAKARPDITVDLGAKAIKLEDEVILPKFQGLLSGEVTPQEMYDTIKKAAIATFGKDGCQWD